MMVIEEVGGQGELVEEVAFGVLDEEQDAKWQRRRVFGGAVGMVSGGEARAEGRDRSVDGWVACCGGSLQ